MLWKRLAKRELEERLGLHLLERLEAILPVIKDGSGIAGDELFRTQTLSRLFDAFAAPESLRDATFRSTIIRSLREEELNALISDLGGPSTLASFRDKAEWIEKQRWTRTGLAGAFVRTMQLEDRFLPPEDGQVPAREVVYPHAQPLKRLKDYQAEVFYRTLVELAPPRGRVVLQMPTGSGKTRTAMELVAAFLESDASGPSRVAWLAHSAELCDQAADSFREVWSHYAPFQLPLLRCWGRMQAIPSESEDRWMWIASLQMAHSLRSKDALPEADLIIVDEAHKVLAPTYQKAVKAMLGSDTRVLGLTATPGRDAVDDAQNAALADFFFGRKVTLDTGGESAIAYLRKRNILAKLEHEVLNTGATVEIGAKRTPTIEDVPESVLRQLAANDLRSVEIATRVAQYAKHGRSCLVFATSVEQSKFLAALLSFMGVTAAHLDGSSSAGERVYAIERFRERKVSVLTNYGVLTTGFDAPKTDVLCIARPTTSIVLYSQMLGRGLRGPAIGGTSSCRVIDVRDNIIGLPDIDELYDFFDEYYDSVETV